MGLSMNKIQVAELVLRLNENTRLLPHELLNILKFGWGESGEKTPPEGFEETLLGAVEVGFEYWECTDGHALYTKRLKFKNGAQLTYSDDENDPENFKVIFHPPQK